MRLIAAALFAGLAIIAGAIVATGDGWVWDEQDAPGYDGYATVISTWVPLAYGARVTDVQVQQVKGPFYRVEFRQDGGPRCALVDVSKQYESETDSIFWVADASEACP